MKEFLKENWRTIAIAAAKTEQEVKERCFQIC